eukprot:Nitzschia sp. Nitz4//scaffold62_size106224//74248//75588//NITZ4_004363-RA/size106224-processed-gene-0.35-mRNA-1//1//CDS//3329555877//7400//frame0
MSNSFEFSDADEWLDITSKEEILQHELAKKANELETRSMELLESNVTIDLLKGHKTLLENEKDELKVELEQSRKAMESVSTELKTRSDENVSLKEEVASMKARMAQREETFEHRLLASSDDLAVSKAHVQSLYQQIEQLKSEQEAGLKAASDKIASLTTTVRQLKDTTEKLEGVNKNLESSLKKSQAALLESQGQEKALRQKIITQVEAYEQKTKEMEQVRGDLSSVAVLTENLKSKNSVLVRSLTTAQKQHNDTKQKLAEVEAREALLKLELKRVKESSANMAQELENKIADGSAKIEKSEDRIIGLESFAQDLKEECASFSVQCEALEEQLRAKDALCESLVSEKEELQNEVQNIKNAGKSESDELKASKEKVKALESEIEKQKTGFEHRLAEIRSILGVSALAEIKTELTSATRRYEKERARCTTVKSHSMRVPLIVDVGKSQ